MQEVILITGASSGIGYDMAKVLAKKGYNLAITARRKDRLERLQAELQAKHNVNIHVFTADLSKTENAKKLYKEVRSKGLVISKLVNNAGFGGYGAFSQTNLETELDMIQLNISSLVCLTKLALEDMKEANKGSILNVGSLLSFFPFPYYAVYAATKAFVLSFSEALRSELSETKISVSVLCPGPTETEFTDEKMLNTNSYKSMKM
ncbi:MAG: SDR family oxidoreductase, partial [Bacteroidota bacterium]